MEVPLIIDGSPAGTLSVTRDGLYTLLEASLAQPREGLVRLWAHGEGKSAYLGVMQPWSGGLWLRRRLTKREFASFPSPIEYASEREAEPRGENKQTGLHNIIDREAVPAEQEEKESLQHTGSDHSSCPWPAEIPAGDLLWYRREDGTLVSHDGVSSLLALPEALHRAGESAVRREIEGKKYLVFRY